MSDLINPSLDSLQALTQTLDHLSTKNASMEDLLATIRGTYKLSRTYAGPMGDILWEDPRVTEHNRAQGPKGILQHVSFTIYRTESGKVTLSVGRIGAASWYEVYWEVKP